MGISSKVIIILIFVLAGVLFFHNFTSINADIGRHIKLGEIMWQLKEVPKTNMLSFTAPDYPFINHHWLSEVIFYKVYSLGSDWASGLKSIMVFKIIVLLAAYLLLFFTVRKHNIFSVVLSFLVSIFVFSARTEPRPEIFSYLIFAAYLLFLYKNRISNFEFRISNFKINSLWILPLLQLFWVNLHVYFIIGPVIYFLFFVEKIVLKKINRQDLLIGLLIILANFANPNFIAGALYPLRVFNNYGYSVVENSSLFFLAKYFGSWSPQDKLTLTSFFILVGVLVLSFWRTKKPVHWLKIRIFELSLILVTVASSFKMQRNTPLYALSLWPVMSNNLDFVFGMNCFKKISKLISVCVVFLLVLGIYLIVSGKFYNWLDSPKIFGLGISSASQDGVDFIKTNKIQGPVFNNFDIGSYLVWQLYPAPNCSLPAGRQALAAIKGRAWCGTGPDQQVFIDGRPEAYPVEFFEKIYKPMQRNEKVWKEMSQKYDINYIFFAHTDMTEWADEFLRRISKDKEWPMVFLNDAIVIFLKDTDANRSVINKYEITERNISDKITEVLNKLNKKDNNAFVNFGNALYRFRWLDGSAKIFEALIANQPDNPYGYQGAGYAYASMNDPATQERAAKNLEKAIGLGFKTFNNYFTLGIIKANLGNYFAAEKNLEKALEINPDNQNAKAALETIKAKLYFQ